MPAGTFTAVGQSNTFIPDHNATGRMVVGFSRNQNKFGLPRYSQIRKVTKKTGLFLQLDQFNAMRIVGSNIDEYVWPDGQARPRLNNNGLEFRYHNYKTVRRNFGQPLGQQSVDQADWDVATAQEAQLSQKAMTARTIQAHDVLALSANWDASHRKDVTTISNAGQWSGALSTNSYIRRSINFAINQIKLDTGSQVTEQDLMLVFNPTTAFVISQTQEVLDHIKQSPTAYENLTNGGRFSQYGIPEKLFGVNIHVEDAVKVTSPKGAAQVSASYVMGDALAYILARPGSIEAPVGEGPSFSTLTTFALEEMNVERQIDTYNRIQNTDVVDDIVTVMTSPVSGFAFLNLY